MRHHVVPRVVLCGIFPVSLVLNGSFMNIVKICSENVNEAKSTFSV